VDPASLDHLAEQQALLGDRHRPRDRDHPIAGLIPHHRLEDVGRLAEPAPPEGGLPHGAQQPIDAGRRHRIEGRQRFQAILMPAPIAAFVSGSRHAGILLLSCSSAGEVAGIHQKLHARPSIAQAAPEC
jgi:hypothetical protein